MKLSIVSLIYRSATYACNVYSSLLEHTPQLGGEVEFFFLANDAEDDVLGYMRDNGYPFVDHRNVKKSEDQLFSMGIGAPEYIHRVYCAWNHAIECSLGEYVLLINSDHVFSHGWLDPILEGLHPKLALSSLTVEPGHPELGHFGASLNGTGSILKPFGRNPRDFDRDAFQQFAEDTAEVGTRKGGVYMPCAFHRQTALEAGLYPEGNLAGKSFNDVVDYGDRLFFRRLAALGVDHRTVMNSIVYHFQQGEMEE